MRSVPGCAREWTSSAPNNMGSSVPVSMDVTSLAMNGNSSNMNFICETNCSSWGFCWTCRCACDFASRSGSIHPKSSSQAQQPSAPDTLVTTRNQIKLQDIALALKLTLLDLASYYNCVYLWSAVPILLAPPSNSIQ